MSKLRVAVVGAGNIAQEHLRVLSGHPACDVVALCDRNPAALEETARRFKIPERIAEAEALARRDDLDAVLVMVTHTATVAIVSLFLEAGLPVLLEKPPGLFSDDTARLADLRARRGGPAAVALNRRFYTVNQAARALVNGSLATVTIEAHEDLTRMTKSRFSATDLPLIMRRRAYANSIHALDLLRYFGGEVRDVYAASDAYENDFPDCVAAVLRYESGALGRVAMDYIGPGSHRFELRTVGMTVRSDGGFGGATVLARGEAERRLEPDGDDRRYKAGFWKQDTAFLDAVLAGKQPAFPAVTLEDALGTMRLIDRICGMMPGRVSGAEAALAQAPATAMSGAASEAAHRSRR
jgi:predicted dehydrogenase